MWNNCKREAVQFREDDLLWMMNVRCKYFVLGDSILYFDNFFFQFKYRSVLLVLAVAFHPKCSICWLGRGLVFPNTHSHTHEWVSHEWPSLISLSMCLYLKIKDDILFPRWFPPEAGRPHETSVWSEPSPPPSLCSSSSSSCSPWNTAVLIFSAARMKTVLCCDTEMRFEPRRGLN